MTVQWLADLLFVFFCFDTITKSDLLLGSSLIILCGGRRDESLNHGTKIELDLHQRAAGHFMRWVCMHRLLVDLAR